jgi:hypothetical protein
MLRNVTTWWIPNLNVIGDGMSKKLEVSEEWAGDSTSHAKF